MLYIIFYFKLTTLTGNDIRYHHLIVPALFFQICYAKYFNEASFLGQMTSFISCPMVNAYHNMFCLLLYTSICVYISLCIYI